MADVTVASIDEMEPIYEGLARRARATLGVTSWGMQVMTLPANWDGYPNHRHDTSSQDPNQEEVYIPLAGAGLLHADGEVFERHPVCLLTPPAVPPGTPWLGAPRESYTRATPAPLLCHTPARP